MYVRVKIIKSIIFQPHHSYMILAFLKLKVCDSNECILVFCCANAARSIHPSFYTVRASVDRVTKVNAVSAHSESRCGLADLVKRGWGPPGICAHTWSATV